MPEISIGSVLHARFESYKSDRISLEEQWLKNIRQYKGVYDPDILSKIPSDRSKVYPKDTHTKVTSFVAKMMEMMFPASEANYSLLPTPTPNLPKDIVDSITMSLIESGAQLTKETISAAIMEHARNAAAAMEKEIKDQLADVGGDKIEYPQLAKKVLRSGANYGFGVLGGPEVRTQHETEYSLNEVGAYSSVKKALRKPFFEFKRVWDIYPDLSARTWWEQEGIFERKVVSKNDLRDLSKRKDYKSDAIMKFIKEHPEGNYSEHNYESQLNEIKHTTNVAKKRRGKYELIRYLGYISGKALSEYGETISESDMEFDIFCDVYMLGDSVVKLDKEPFGSNPADQYHAFIYEEDEDSPLTGSGLPECLRDSQMKLCAVDRVIMDNTAACAGPIFEVNHDLTSRHVDSSNIRAFSVIAREGRGAEAAAQAVRSISVDSHISELLNLRGNLTQVFDIESNLPSWLMGNTQPLGEAFRTTNNMSMMQGGANMVTKDIVRSFDRFTTSVIGSMIKWNMLLNPKKEIRGDFQVQAKGNMSLVAKEVRGAAIEQLMAGLTDDERALFKTLPTLVEKLRSRDLPEDLLVSKEEAAVILKQKQEERSAQAQMVNNEVTARTQSLSAKASKDMATANDVASTTQAKVAELLAKVEMYITNAKGTKDRGQLEYIRTILEQLKTESGNDRPDKRDTGGVSDSANPLPESAV